MLSWSASFFFVGHFLDDETWLISCRKLPNSCEKVARFVFVQLIVLSILPNVIDSFTYSL